MQNNNDIPMKPTGQSAEAQLMHAIGQQRFPHAMLFFSFDRQLQSQLIQRLATALFCQQNLSPCPCKNCTLLKEARHPDLLFIQPEKPGARLKVAQIRGLQEIIYREPQCAKHRIVVIEKAQDMHSSVANALLKLLEEPPLSCHFILLAEQLNTILPTIRSRCQIYHLQAAFFSSDLLHAPESWRTDMSNEALQAILQSLISLKQKESIASMIAEEWKDYPLMDVLWLIHLILSHLIHLKALNQQPEPAYKQAFSVLLADFNIYQAFQFLDEIASIQKKFSHNNINHLLLCEKILNDLMEVFTNT